MAARGSSGSLLKLALKNKAESAAGSPRKVSLERSGCGEEAPPADAKKLKKAEGDGVVVQRCLCSPTQHPGSFRCRLHRAARTPASAAGNLSAAMPAAPGAKAVAAASTLASSMARSGGRPSSPRRRERDASPRARRLLVGAFALSSGILSGGEDCPEIAAPIHGRCGLRRSRRCAIGPVSTS